MPQYVTLPSPNKNWWEPAANQTSNMLWQLAQMKMAHNMRLEEVDRQLEAKKIELQEQRGYEEEKASRPPEVYELGGQKFIARGGTLLQIKEPELDKKPEENLTATQKDFERAQRDPAFAKYVKEKPQWGADPNRPRDQQLQELQATNTLNNEFNNRSKEFLMVRDSYNRINASAKDPSAAGDLAVIFNYMKMLDPGSTVREGEFANAQNSAGIPDRIRAMYNKTINGERLAPDTRADFVNRSKMIYGENEKTHKQLRNEFSKKAQRWGINPQDAITDYLPPKEETPTPVAPKQRPPLDSFKR
jgi:hypothetical protein